MHEPGEGPAVGTVRVAAWVPESKGVTPGQRFRIEQWESALRSEGIELTYFPFLDGTTATLLKHRGQPLRKAKRLTTLLGRRLRLAARMRGFDLVYVFRETALIGPALAERVLARRGLPFVLDFDDSVWIRYVSPANAYWSYLRFPGKTATTCRLSTHVMAGNETLAAYARRQAERVSVVPTTIDTDIYVPRPTGNLIPVIGWTGSYSTGQYLNLVKPVLQRLSRRLNFRVRIIGARDFEIEGVDVEVLPWRAESEVRDLADIDIGLMPLPDAAWERGKCGLKALQYMALGVPAVVSPVGVNSTIVTHGETGLLASSEQEWEAALERLLLDPDLRRRLGSSGRACVERAYSTAVHAPRVAEIFRGALAGTATP
jgi:glycosyltransferase involved in cell wall biosynthesis